MTRAQTPRDDCLDAVLMGLSGIIVLSVSKAAADVSRQVLESEDCPEPPYQDPETVVANARDGRYVFIDDGDRPVQERANAHIVTDSAVSLEAWC